MKRTLLDLLTLAISCLLAISFITSCGGGGGGGGDAGLDPDAVSLSTSALSFTHSMAEPPPPSQTVTAWFGGAAYFEVGYPPGVSVPAWLTIRQADSSDDSSPIDFEFSINQYTITSGTHQTTVRFVASDLLRDPIGYRDLRITCVVTNALGLGESEIDFMHTVSETEGPENQSVSLLGENISWTAVADQSWVELTTTSGTTPDSLDIGVTPDGLGPGLYTSTITVRDTTSGQTETLAVILAIEPHQIWVGNNGVAFASFPTAPSVLSHTVKVVDNTGVPSPWSAVSDQAWLDATASGTTDGALTLTADPSGLPTDQIHFATVTVDSSDPNITNTDQIRVGFYVAGSDPAVTELNIEGSYLAPDPIRPYVYMTFGSTLDVFNIYTGEKVDSITADASLARMTISTDGTTLYAHASYDKDIVLVDLDTYTISGKWIDIGDVILRDTRLAYTRFNGKGALVVGNRTILDADDGSLAATFWDGLNYDIVMAASHDDSSFYAIETGLTGASFELNRYVGHYSYMFDTFKVTLTNQISTYFTTRSIAVNEAGTKIYLTDTLRNYVFNGDSLAEGNALADPDGLGLAVGPTGKVYVPKYGWGLSTSVIHSFNADDSVGDTYTVSGDLSTREIQISGDGLRLLSLSEDRFSNFLNFTPVTP